MVTDKRVAERRLEEMLMTLHWHRRSLEAYRNKGDATGVGRCEQILKLDHRHIRKHCAEHDLELPHGVPPEDAA